MLALLNDAYIHDNDLTQQQLLPKLALGSAMGGPADFLPHARQLGASALSFRVIHRGT
jgi:hypothetical protein